MLLSCPCGRGGLMRSIWAYIALIHPFAVGMVVLTTAILALLAAGGMPPAGTLLRLIGVVLLSQVCVGITNELHDLPIDRLSKPGKPLVSGQARPEYARIAAALAGLGSLLLGLSFGPIGLLFAVLGTAAGLIYNYWLKGTTLSWLPYALGFSLLVLWPFAALERWAPALGYVWLIILPASVTLNLAQSLGDIESDTAQGIRGLAQRIGRRFAPAAMAIAATLTILLAVLTGSSGGRQSLLLFAATAAFSLVLMSTVRCYHRPGPASWLLAWRLVAAAMALLAAGWLGTFL